MGGGTGVAAPTAPGTMSAPTVTQVSASALDVVFSAPASDGGSAITSYDWRYSTASDMTGATTQTGKVSGNDITGLAAATTYYVQVRANNLVGAGDWSSNGSAATAANPPTLTTVTISCSNATLQTAYSGRWSPCGIQLNGSSNAANYSTIAYAWRNSGGAIGGATSADYTPPTGAGYTGLYLRVTVDAGLGTEIVVDSAVTTVAFVYMNNVEGSSNASAQTVNITNNVGEKIYLTANALVATGLGNATFEGSGPTAVASHANHLGNSGSVANRACHMLGKADDNETAINWTFSTSGGSRTVPTYQIVGYTLTPTEIDAGGDAGSNANSAAVTVNVPAGGAVISHAGVYDTLADPSGIQFFTGSAFQKGSGAAFYVVGVGYLIAANAALVITASKVGNAVSKMHAVFVLTPEVPA
jgi:hypothetical protein